MKSVSPQMRGMGYRSLCGIEYQSFWDWLETFGMYPVVGDYNPYDPSGEVQRTLERLRWLETALWSQEER